MEKTAIRDPSRDNHSTNVILNSIQDPSEVPKVNSDKPYWRQSENIVRDPIRVQPV